MKTHERHFQPDIVIYHGGCYDGFTAAWLLWRKFPDALFIPAVYGKTKNIPDGLLEPGRERKVLIVDFSFSRDELIKLNEVTDDFLVLDHHKTAEEALHGLDFAVFDMDRAGCQMAWDWLADAEPLFSRTAEPRPWLVEYVADRDLWRKVLPDTEAVSAYISTVPMTWNSWEDLFERPLPIVVALGAAVQQGVDRYCERAGAEAVTIETPHGICPMVNAPYMHASELASWLIDQHDSGWAVAWFQRGDGIFQYSLRGRDLDVQEVAKQYGGGGHVGAAGFESVRPPWDLPGWRRRGERLDKRHVTT